MHRTYMGKDIYPMDRNSWGGKWYARCNGLTLRADTLAGLKRLIREDVEHVRANTESESAQ